MYFENGFVKNEKLLQENSNIDDLLNRDSEIDKFSNKIDELHGSLIRGFVGQFGIGKSTLITNVKKSRKDKDYDEKWFEFDAWKYPDRKDLREGFVLDFARQVDEGEFNKAKKKIDGTKYKKVKSAVSTMGSTISALGYMGVGSVVSSISDFFNTSPARRVFEIQEIFQELVNKIDEKKIIIVVEDIDRSGDAGIFFLETLKQFISKNDFGKEILIIMPLGTDEYYKNLDSYLKPIDYFDFFTPGAPKLEKFVKEIFVDEIVNDNRRFQPLKEFLEGLFEYYPNEMNIRKLKLIIRKANQNHIIMLGKYDNLFELDWRLNIIFEAMKFIGFNDSKNSLFEQLKLDKDNASIDRKSLIGAYVNNLVGLTKWGYGHWYFGNGNSLYDVVFDDSGKKKKELITQDTLAIKFYESMTDKEIVGCLYVRKDFKSSPEAIILPLAYFDY